MFDFVSRLEDGLSYQNFLAKYATDAQRERWDEVHRLAALTDAQRQLLQSFRREMHVLVVAGAWCGDCINQCPIFDRFAAENERIRIRYFDRDEHPELAAELSVCGGNRVPAVQFLSEDGHPCGRYGDRTLSKYREIAASQTGAACPTGIVPPEGDLLSAVIGEWLNEFERVQLILRTSSRLRQLHGD